MGNINEARYMEGRREAEYERTERREAEATVAVAHKNAHEAGVELPIMADHVRTTYAVQADNQGHHAEPGVSVQERRAAAPPLVHGRL
ncbi:hypothetical protein Y032_0126g1323 [Ancylostoma ceylanicum]|uniref:Uncharacterized protein n=1 Tax=Ancylostoma ceylanicum TaxID=53326 RepID=A0A016T8G6_9BILA|nr:hypothetical protein Y032_0126g1323 [Ancylostoma ceylanicum]